MRKDIIWQRVAALAVAFVSLLGAFTVAGTAAQADPTPVCYSNSICFFDNGSNLYQIANRDVADAPRNTCFTGINGSGYVYNNNGYRWYLFRTSNCSGSHIEIAPHATESLPSGWTDPHSYYRTSSTS